ncbi:MAG: Crp/Fnr family transcriptional regulator [Bacilli bacterium]
MNAQKLINILLNNNEKVITYSSSEVIFNEGEECNFVCFILNGSVKISSIIGEQESIIAILQKNDLFGNALLFSSSSLYQGDVISLSKTELIRVNKLRLLDYFKNEEFLLLFLSLLSDERLKDKETIKTISIISTKDRLLYKLKNNDELLYIKSVVELSKELHTSRENLSRIINSLSKEGVIKKIGHYIKANKKSDI